MAQDDMLKEEGEKTSPASPAETKTQSSDSGSLIDETEQQTPEEVEFNALKGSTQERIKRIIREKNEALAEAQQARTSFVPPPPAYQPQPEPNVQDAVRKLDEVGIATKDFTKKVVSEELGNLRWQFELDRLESRHSGEDGKPKFDRNEYLDYINRYPQYRNYLPEDVYEKMYKEELSDFGQPQPAPKKGTTLRPTKATVGEEPLSPELIEERLKEPDGQQWYTRNVDKINRVLGKMS